MAGEKGAEKRSAAQADHRGGDGRVPKIRKVTQEEMGKQKGKLQIKDSDKPMELEKVRRLEEKGKKAAVPEGAAVGFATGMMEKKVAFYKKIVEMDFGYLFFTEKEFECFPGGPTDGRALNNTISRVVKEFKERAAMRLKEYDATGCFKYYPPDGNFDASLPVFVNRLCQRAKSEDSARPDRGATVPLAMIYST